MIFKRTEGFRFAFGDPIAANFVRILNGKLENEKHACSILDISPHGMKMFSKTEIGEHSNKLVQIEMQFVLDEALIRAVGEVVWKKQFGKDYHYGIVFENQPIVEELIVSELKIRRKKEVKRS
ncbi:PilZ domain-containing protein [Solibacillus sp. R5-41]|uniref:PilZ domain-containing protein n=1 Tax=Solibacillus sp. R5-41 TaxID=2048654 RepID=UPI000C1274CF|nr:PilZ domain-containing protein [Solibacillus sp. R5-41]ATP39091.1 PilZ domain-containing protein [Solibacillus sp. R5-41]